MRATCSLTTNLPTAAGSFSYRVVVTPGSVGKDVTATTTTVIGESALQSSRNLVITQLFCFFVSVFVFVSLFLFVFVSLFLFVCFFLSFFLLLFVLS